MGDLRGKRILVTRSRSQASRLSRLLVERGAIPVECPVLAVEALDSTIVRAALRFTDGYDGVVFTSQNGVKAFAELIDSYENVPQVYAIGPATAAVVEKRLGLKAKRPDERFVSESLLKMMVDEGVEGRGFLLLLADETRDVLAKGLKAAGASATVVPIYRTVVHPDASVALLHALVDGLDAVTVASSKTMEFLHRALASDLRPVLKRMPIVSIGPITSATAIAMGYDVAEEAEPATLEGLLSALERAVS